jgi:predicted transcriptional regulator of viral defense system
MKYMDSVVNIFDRDAYPVFSINDVKTVLKQKQIGTGYLHLMLHNMLLKKRIARITRGMYTFHDDAVVAGFAFAPFYYGLESALWLIGISGQGTNYVVMTSRNVRTGTRSFKGRNYRINRVKGNQMFGYGLLKYGKFWIPVSDLEKTIIDMLYFNNHIDEELWPDILRRLEMKKLKEYLKGYKPEFRNRVLELVGGHRKA